MFLAWASSFLNDIPFSTVFVRKTQKKMEAFLSQCINAEIENCEKKEYKTLLLFMKKANDPRTGKILSRDDLINNGVLLLYPPLFRC
jgi:hypothetical protein